jgi:hypothetical protein
MKNSSQPSALFSVLCSLKILANRNDHRWLAVVISLSSPAEPNKFFCALMQPRINLHKQAESWSNG